MSRLRVVPLVVVQLLTTAFLLAAGEDRSPKPDVEREILRTVEELYVEGLRIRDFDRIRSICWPDTRLMGVRRDGTPNTTTLDEWSRRFDPDDPPFETLEHTIRSIHVAGTAAQVQIRFVIDGDRVITDYLQLLKIDDRWRIVHIIDG